MPKIVVTTCSLNHLAQAKGLGDSIIQYNRDYKLVIGLVDRIDGRINKEDYAPHEIIEAHELNIPQFAEMVNRYNLLELNCALKIFFTDHALKKYNAAEIIFLDSDILVFDSLSFIEEQLQTNSILITPHIITPYPADGHRPFEREMLKNGIYNAGFFALKNDANGNNLIEWMKPRMIDQCFENPKLGLTVDQKWFNFVPVFFQRVLTLYHPGCNAAYWNLHERTVSRQGEKFFVNGQPLLFFHYSGYSMQHPGQLSRHQDRVIMNDVLKELFRLYHDTLQKNGHEKLLPLKCYYSGGRKSVLQKLGLKR